MSAIFCKFGVWYKFCVYEKRGLKKINDLFVYSQLSIKEVAVEALARISYAWITCTLIGRNSSFFKYANGKNEGRKERKKFFRHKFLMN